MISKNKKGFTLAELLVVVAIIAVLVAVSIPVFAGKLDKSKEAACLANRRSLLAELRTKQLSGDLGSVSGAITLTENQKNEYVCPAGGTITAKINESGSVVVKCSYHNPIFEAMKDKGKLSSAFSSIFTSKDLASGKGENTMYDIFFSGGQQMIDKGVKNTDIYDNVKSELAKTLKLDVDDFDYAAKTDKQNQIIYLYVSESLTGKNKGDSVKATKLVYRVNIGNGNVGKIEEQRDGIITLNGSSYSWQSPPKFTAN